MDSQPMSKEEEQIVESLFNGIDFVNIQEAMKITGWRYFDSDTTPTIASLKETARYTILGVIRDKHTTALSFGGFKAEMTNFEHDPNVLRLVFEFESEEVYYERNKEKNVN